MWLCESIWAGRSLPFVTVGRSMGLVFLGECTESKSLLYISIW